MVTERREYRNSPTILITRHLDEPEYYGLTVGVNKARLIVDNIEDIKKFVEENEVKK